MEPHHRNILLCAVTVASVVGITYYLLEDDRKVKRRKTSRAAERATLRSLNQIRDDELTVESDIKKLEQNVNDKDCDDKAFKQREYTLAHANEMLLRLMEKLDAIRPLTAIMGERNLDPNPFEDNLVSNIKTRKRQIIESIQALFRRVDSCNEKIKSQAKEREEIAKEKARLEQEENERKAREAEELERAQKEKERLQQEEAERIAKEEAERRITEEENQLVQEVAQQVEEAVKDSVENKQNGETENHVNGNEQVIVEELKEELKEKLVKAEYNETEEVTLAKENGATEEKEAKEEEPIKEEVKEEEPVKEQATEEQPVEKEEPIKQE